MEKEKKVSVQERTVNRGGSWGVVEQLGGEGVILKKVALSPRGGKGGE